MDLSIRTWHLRTAFVHYVLFCSPQLASSELSPQSFSPSQMKGGKAQRPVPHWKRPGWHLNSAAKMMINSELRRIQSNLRIGMCFKPELREVAWNGRVNPHSIISLKALLQYLMSPALYRTTEVPPINSSHRQPVIFCLFCSSKSPRHKMNLKTRSLGKWNERTKDHPFPQLKGLSSVKLWTSSSTYCI